MEQRRTIVRAVQSTAGSERSACRWLGFHRSAVRHAPIDLAIALLCPPLRLGIVALEYRLSVATDH